jgi:hypothetical protein
MHLIKLIVVSALFIPFLSAPAQLRQWKVVRIRHDYSCDPSTQGGLTFEHCGLRFDHFRLLQGNDEREIDYSTLFRPVELSRVVVGDSARRYATRYRYESYAAKWFISVGSIALLSSIIYPKFNVCEQGPCDREQARVFSRSLLRGSLVSFTFGIPLSFLASQSGDRAVAWHNGSLRR